MNDHLFTDDGPIESNWVPLCIHCDALITPENDSGWEKFTQGGTETQSVCNDCNISSWEKMSYKFQYTRCEGESCEVYLSRDGRLYSAIFPRDQAESFSKLPLSAGVAWIDGFDPMKEVA